MPVLFTLISLIGAVLAFVYVLRPIRAQGTTFGGEIASANAPDNPGLTALLEQRESALAGLAELDFDHNLGNLSEADYQSLRTQYRMQAIEVLRTLEQQGVVTHDARLTADIGAASPAQAALIEGNHVDRRVLWFTGGAIAVALLAISIATMLLRANAAATSGEDAPGLNIVHAHAVLLVPNTRVALLAHHSGLLRSTDDGSSWQPVQGITGDVLSLVGSGDRLYMTLKDAVMTSRDMGQTWANLSTPKLGSPLEAIAVGDGKPTLLYANVTGAGLYRTSDLQQWQLSGSGLSSGVVALAVRSGPLAALYAAGPNDGVLASGDEGRTWGSANGVLNATLPTLAVRALTFDPQSGDQFTTPDGTVLSGALYVGTDLGLFKSVDGGSAWSALPLQQSISAISARAQPNPLIMAVDSRERVWRSKDHGSSWSAKP